ncbi:MAG: flippase-like domain-containing protein [Spirochaetes bacterium]|nr:MAG: flippase-like domain-containing protein [Spirochaetota bacterium]
MKDTTTNHAPESADEIIRERRKRILNPRTVVFFALSAGLVYFLLRRIDLGETARTFRDADYRLLGLACVIYVFSNLFKSIRFAVLLKDLEVPQFKLFAITSYHNFFNQILPARTGELTFVYYLKKLAGADISRGLHALLVTRIFDFIIVAAFFVCSIIIHYGRQTSVALLAVGIGFLALSIVSLFYLKWIVILSRSVFERTMAVLRLREKSIVKKVLAKVIEVEDEFSGFDTKRFIPGLAFTSLLVWGALYSMSFVTIHAFGVDINFMQSVAGATGAVLTNVLPINSFGSFGTLEVGWTGGFMLVGMGEQDAITTGFGNHILNFVAAAAIAIAGAIVLKVKNRK